MMRRHIHAVYTPHKGDWTGNLCSAVSWSPPPILSPLFCSISFITASRLWNQAIVQLLDHEGQQYIHCGFGLQSVGGFSQSHWRPLIGTDVRGRMRMDPNDLQCNMTLNFFVFSDISPTPISCGTSPASQSCKPGKQFHLGPL